MIPNMQDMMNAGVQGILKGLAGGPVGGKGKMPNAGGFTSSGPAQQGAQTAPMQAPAADPLMDKGGLLGMGEQALGNWLFGGLL